MCLLLIMTHSNTYVELNIVGSTRYYSVTGRSMQSRGIQAIRTGGTSKGRLHTREPINSLLHITYSSFKTQSKVWKALFCPVVDLKEESVKGAPFKGQGGSKLAFWTTSEKELIQSLSDGNLCSFGWTSLCRVLLNLLRAVQTGISAEKWPQPSQAGSPFSIWHFPSCPHSLHQYSQPEWRRPLGRGEKWEWERKQHNTGIQRDIKPSWAI